MNKNYMQKLQIWQRSAIVEDQHFVFDSTKLHDVFEIQCDRAKIVRILARRRDR